MTDQELIDSQSPDEKALIKAAYNRCFMYAGFTEGQTDDVWLLGTLSVYEIHPYIGLTIPMRVVDLQNVTL